MCRVKNKRFHYYLCRQEKGHGVEIIMNRKCFQWMILLLILGMCSGCGTKELEERGFPLAIGIDQKQEEIILSFDFSDVSSSKEQASSSGQTALSVEGDTYYEVQKAYENNTNKVLDYNHLKAIILGESFFQNTESLRKLFSFWEQEEIVARNTYLFLAEESAKMLSLTEKTDGSVGKYLEQMTESQEDFKEEKIMTLGKLMNQWHNQNEVLLLPVLTNNGGIPSITEYAVVDAFVYKGRISVEDAMKVFLTQGQLQQFLYHLKSGELVEIENIKSQRKISSEKNQIVIEVSIQGDLRPKFKEESFGMNKEQLVQRVERELENSLEKTAEELQKNSEFDISNSFIMLGGQNRALYEKYQQDQQGYESQLVYQYFVDLNILNE